MVIVVVVVMVVGRAGSWPFGERVGGRLESSFNGFEVILCEGFVPLRYRCDSDTVPMVALPHSGMGLLLHLADCHHVSDFRISELERESGKH